MKIINVIMFIVIVTALFFLWDGKEHEPKQRTEKRKPLISSDVQKEILIDDKEKANVEFVFSPFTVNEAQEKIQEISEQKESIEISTQDERVDRQILRLLSKENFENIEDFLDTAFPDLGDISPELKEIWKKRIPFFFRTRKLLSREQFAEFSVLNAIRQDAISKLSPEFRSRSQSEYRAAVDELVNEDNIKKLNLLTKEQLVKQVKIMEALNNFEEIRKRKAEGKYPTFIARLLPPQTIMKRAKEIMAKTLVEGRLE